MRTIVAFVVIAVLGCAVAGCADPNIKPTNVKFGSSTDAMTMGPTLRMLSERDRPIDDRQVLPTQCTEPSPDAVIAFSRSLQGQASFQETGAPTVSGSFNAQANELATSLGGRTAGVLALRDGLFAACQAYVNGVLGHDAYALILSQYGNLLVAVAGTASGGNPAVFSAQDSMMVGMLVACISENDPTRIRPYLPNGKIALNPLLTPKACTRLIDKIANKILAKQTVASKTPADKSKAAGTQQVTKTAITKTITKTSGPAPAEGAGGAGGATK